jgi:hypothetical protein
MKMKTIKLPTEAVCYGCEKCDYECEGCEHEDVAFMLGEMAFTATLGQLVAIEEGKDEVVDAVVNLLAVALNVGQKRTDYGEYLLELEKTIIGDVNIVEFMPDGAFRILGLQELPAAFSGRHKRSHLRVILQDVGLLRDLNQHITNIQWGMAAPEDIDFSPWELWHADDIADNLVQESHEVHQRHKKNEEDRVLGEKLLQTFLGVMMENELDGAVVN